MRAASSTSVSDDSNSLSGFEKMAFSSYQRLRGKSKSLFQFTIGQEVVYLEFCKGTKEGFENEAP